MKQNECMSTSDSIQTKTYKAAIIGLGGAAGRILDRLKECSIPDARLFAFGMNRQEIGALSITDKFIVGNDGLGSGKDRDMVMSACQASMPVIEKILSVPIMAVFVVCLGGATGESCMEMFLRNASHSNLWIKLLIATLPHHSEGMEKRENARKIIEKMKPYVDSIIIIDYEELEATSIVSLYAKADAIIEDTIESFVSLVTKLSLVCFDYNDVIYFLRKAKTRIVDFVSINGDVDNIRNRFENFSTILPTRYLSVNDIQAMIVEIRTSEEEKNDNTKLKKVLDILNTFTESLPGSIWLSLTISINPNMANNNFKLNFFLTKKQSTYHEEGVSEKRIS
jgi:cell division protein ftsZ